MAPILNSFLIINCYYNKQEGGKAILFQTGFNTEVDFMWHKRKWVIIGIVAAVVILAAGILGGVAYAQSPTPSSTTGTGTGTGQTLLDRVATILGIDKTKLQDAVNQAERDMSVEKAKTSLDKQVQAGKITQKQEDDYLNWLKSRPTDVPPNLGIQGFGPGKMMGPRGGMMFRGGFPPFPGKPGTATPSPSATPSPK